MKKIVLAAGFMIGLCGTVQAQTPVLASILIFAGNFCPLGYLPTDGRLVAISQNTALFSLLGTTYGGNGTTNFALPNTKPVFTQTRATFTLCIATQGVFPSRP